MTSCCRACQALPMRSTGSPFCRMCGPGITSCGPIPLASLERLLAGLAIATLIALVIGTVIGMLPYVRALIAPFVATFSMVPPLALLPILFIVMGLGDASKMTLIVIGIAPPLIRDLALRTLELPREQIVKAETLGASSWQIALRVVLPQILPRLLTSLRLQLGPAFLFLIAAEAVSADAGLGYRIFLVRRYLAMDVIFPYVAWITAAGRGRGSSCWNRRGARCSPGRISEARDERADPRQGLEGIRRPDRAGEHLASRSRRGPSWRWSGRRAAASPRFLRMLLGQEQADARADPAGRRAAAAGAGTGSRRGVPALFGVSASDGARQCHAGAGTARRAPVGQAVRHCAARGQRRGAGDDRRGRAGGVRGEISGTACRAGCSNGSRWRRR